MKQIDTTTRNGWTRDLVGLVGLALLAYGIGENYGWPWAATILGAVILVIVILGAALAAPPRN